MILCLRPNPCPAVYPLVAFAMSRYVLGVTAAAPGSGRGGARLARKWVGPVVRRPVAWVVAVVLFVEALGIGALNWFLGIVVDRQDMSLAGLDPDVMSMSSKVGGVVVGAYFALTGLFVDAPRP